MPIVEPINHTPRLHTVSAQLALAHTMLHQQKPYCASNHRNYWAGTNRNPHTTHRNFHTTAYPLFVLRIYIDFVNSRSTPPG